MGSRLKRTVLIAGVLVLFAALLSFAALAGHTFGYARGQLHVGAACDASLIAVYMTAWRKAQEGPGTFREWIAEEVQGQIEIGELYKPMVDLRTLDLINAIQEEGEAFLKRLEREADVRDD